MDVTEIAGLAGVVFYIGSYALLQGGIVRGNTYAYPILNIFAASLVLISLTSAYNLSSTLIQISWVVISLFGILRLYLIERRLRFTEEETALITLKFPHLGRANARRLLDTGRWSDEAPGTTIATRGVALNRLIYLHTGAAEVKVNNQSLAEIDAGGFVGEMSVMTGAPASADVTLSAPSRLFTLPADGIERLCARDQELRRLLEICLAADMKEKLLAAGRRVEAPPA